MYRCRAQFLAPVAPTATTASGRRAVKSRSEAERRQTIAERKQAELAATATGGKAKPGTTAKEGDD